MNNKHLHSIFINELRSQLEELTLHISNTSSEKQQFQETIEDLFIITHTIKGNSSAHKNNTKNSLSKEEETILENLIIFSHKTEDFLEKLKDNPKYSEAIHSLLFEIETCFTTLINVFSNSIENNSTGELDSDLNFVLSILNKVNSFQTNANETTTVAHSTDIYTFTLSCPEELKHPFLAIIYREIEEYYHLESKLPSDEDLAAVTDFEEVEIKFSENLDEKNTLDFLTKIEYVENVSKKENSTKEEKVQPNPTLNKNVPQEVPSSNENNNSLLRIEPSRIDNVLKHTSQLVILKNKLNEFLAENNFLAGTTKRKELESIFEDLTSHVEFLQESVLDIRMTPFEQLFIRFPKDVKRIGLEFKKNINFQTFGQRTEIDKNILDELYEPIIHLIRNSIIHGIETEEERLELGKTPTGTISIEAKHIRNKVQITISDDGRGIDIEVIKQKALDLEIYTPEQISLMNPSELINLIFLQGVSTSIGVTTYSGRGVGMSAFRKKIEELQGHYEIITEQNKGTKFIIYLPLTTTIIDAIIMKINNDLYSIPLTQIEEITYIHKNDILYNNEKAYFFWRNIEIPIIFGNQIFKNNSPLSIESDTAKETKDFNKIVIVHSQNQLIGLTFDTFITQQSIVVKQLHPFLSKNKEIDNYHIISDGSISLIIDTNSLTN